MQHRGHLGNMARNKASKASKSKTDENAISSVLEQAGILPQTEGNLTSFRATESTQFEGNLMNFRTNESTQFEGNLLNFRTDEIPFRTPDIDDCIEDTNRWARKHLETFDMYIERFLSQIGPKFETIADVLTERNKRSETSQPLDSKRHKPSPAKIEDDDVIVIDHKPHLEAWKAYFRAREFAKNPFVEAPDIKRSVMSFLLKLDQAKKDGKDPLFFLYGGFNASADLKRNVFAALQSEGELNLDKFLSNAKHEADQTRSTIINKKGFKKDPKHIEDLEAEDWSKEDLEKIRDRVEKKVKAFLLADFEEPRQDIDGMFPNLYALVALTFSKGPVSTVTKKPLWRSIRNPIRVAFEKHFPSPILSVDFERNDHLISSCLGSFSRVAQKFSDELWNLSPCFEKMSVNGWCWDFSS